MLLKRQLQHGQSVALTCFDVVALVVFVVVCQLQLHVKRNSSNKLNMRGGVAELKDILEIKVLNLEILTFKFGIIFYTFKRRNLRYSQVQSTFPIARFLAHL